MNVIDLKTDPKLLATIQSARDWKSSPDELRKQRVSFIMGSLDKSSSVTREKVENVLNSQIGLPA